MDINLQRDIGDRLRERREELGMTQDRAAELLGICTGYYGGIERGNRRLSAELIMTICQRMDVEPNRLFLGQQVSESRVMDVFRRCPQDKQAEVMDIMEHVVDITAGGDTVYPIP